MMRKNFWHLFKAKLWGEKFWTEGHFYRSVGAVNSETMKHYIEESQEKHWRTTPIIKMQVVNQKRMNDF